MDRLDLKNFSKEDYLKLKKRISIIKRKYRILDSIEEDELVNIVMEEWIDGKCTNALLEHTVISFIRRNFGDSRNIGHSERQKFNNAKEYDDRDIVGRCDGILEEFREYLDEYTIRMPIIDRVIINLIRYGYISKEISEILMVTEGAISARIRNIGLKFRRIKFKIECEVKTRDVFSEWIKI